ncbi:hypothetical protein KOR34_24440 [Posidoniimonas corsicana]|uniref:Uncharacterized protein n=1 Tax=Posidoniimonas corsicana TaxID=1938618 RepID=A0A5C5VII0_9BACT|nr:hypothetical protein [Posidoniimonas corsicana]TWT37492.1 hypothetical protein KOR34_24440 [Posidoniimonas corsicana]
MPKTIQRPQTTPAPTARVRPSIVAPGQGKPFTLDQELEPFGAWVGDPIWAPPKDSSPAMAESMLKHTRPFTPRDQRWQTVIEQHRDEFTQVREIDLCRASIRLPKGRFFMMVTEREDFDKITDVIPACVQTRLEEFLAGPGRRPGVKVYYLKPLCVESGDQLILTTRKDLMAAIDRVQKEVFKEYSEMAPAVRTLQAATAALNLALTPPRAVLKFFSDRRQKAIDAYQARLEFKRRKVALGAARTHRKCRTDGCSFDEMLALTNPLQRAAVVARYCADEELSRAQRKQLIQQAAGETAPWFMSMFFSGSYLYTLTMIAMTPPFLVCDPAFVAEMPDAPGELLKIGHFDEVDGVTHVEI